MKQEKTSVIIELGKAAENFGKAAENILVAALVSYIWYAGVDPLWSITVALLLIANKIEELR